MQRLVDFIRLPASSTYDPHDKRIRDWVKEVTAGREHVNIHKVGIGRLRKVELFEDTDTGLCTIVETRTS